MQVCLTIYLSALYFKISAEYTSNWPCCIPLTLFALLLKQREEESKSPGLVLLLTSCYHLSFTVCSIVCHHLCPLLRQLRPHFHLFFLWHRLTLTHTHTFRGETWLTKEAKLDQRPCVREPGYLVENSCPLLSLPLTPAWQQPEIWGLSRPLSWGKRTGQHTYTQDSFCLCSLSLSLAHPGLQRRKKAVCLCSFTHSVTNRNHRFTYTLPPPTSQNH